MRSITLIILHALLAQATAKGLEAQHSDDTKGTMDNFADKLTDKLMSRGIQMPMHDAEMDEATLAKTHPDSALGKTASRLASPSVSDLPQSRANSLSQVHAMQKALRSYGIPPSPMEELALTVIDASGGCTRDVSMNAQVREVFSRMDAKDKATLRAATKAQDMAGITEPMGLFDPLGFTSDCPTGRLQFLREAELKHGRTCMLASLGIVIHEKFHPFYGGKIDTLQYKMLPGFPESAPLGSFWVACILGILAVELTTAFKNGSPIEKFYDASKFAGPILEKTPGAYVDDGILPGDYGYDPLGLKPKDEKGFLEMQNKELNNGRLAMVGTAGMVLQELATGVKTFP